MKWSQSLILISAFSYFGAFIMLLLGYPSMLGPSYQLQLVWAISGTVFCLATLKYKKLGYLGILYGILAILSFSGIQVWINYDGGYSLGPYMALWDIVLGMAMLDDLDLPRDFKQ